MAESITLYEERERRRRYFLKREKGLKMADAKQRKKRRE